MKKRNLILGLAIFSLANLGLAQTLYWDGGTVNITTNGDGISQGAAGTWNNSTQNWDQGAGLAHIAWPGGADAVFAAPGIAAGAGTVTLGAALTANSITATTANYVIVDGGNTANILTLNAVTNSASLTIGANVADSSSGFTMTGSSGTTTVALTNTDAGLTGPITINSGTLQLGGSATAVSPNNFGSVSLVASSATLALQSAANITYAQNITGNGSVAVSGKSSSVIVTLSGGNTYTNTTIVNQATLSVANVDETSPNCSIGTGPLQIGNGASATTFTYAYPGGNVTTARPLIFGGTTTSLTIQNNSSGTLTLAGPVSFAANSTVPRVIGLAGNEPTIWASTIPDNITATATNRTSLLVKNTAGGAWMLTGSNTFSGGITYSGGGSGAYALIITNDWALGNPTNTILCSTNGTIVSACSGEIDITNSPVTLAATRTITFTGPVPGVGMPTMYFKTTDSNSLTVASYITGTGNVQRRGSPDGTADGAVIFVNDTNNFSGTFLAGPGVTEFTSVANSGTLSSLGTGVTNSGIITLGNSLSAENFTYIGTNNSSTTRPLSWTGLTGTLALSANGAGTVSYLASAILKSGVGSANLNLQGTNTGNNTLAQVINDSSGTTTLTKSGTGTWLLTGANTYGGATTISGGTLSVSSDGNLGTAPGSATPNFLTIDNGTFLASAGFTLNVNRGLALGPTGTNSASNNNPAAGPGTISVATGTLNYGGVITDSTTTNSGSLIKTGAGTLTLSGANSYTGDTTISGGTLALSGSGTIGSGTNLAIAAGATFDVSALGGGYALASGQALLATSGATATVNGSLNLASASVLMTNVVNTPTITVTGGALTLASGMSFTVNFNNSGTGLSTGSYKLISKGAGGSVAGTAPSVVTVGGDGLASGATGSLSISNNELYLIVSGGTLYPPVVNGFSVAAGQAVLSFSGTNGQPWKVLSSTNLALPRVSWSIEATGTFAGSVVNYTNASPVDPQRFYIITSP
jgi:fibronectin-binding autotransporter adhesin